jgi:ABC-type branched-subunit amino acid transport system ATPase component
VDEFFKTIRKINEEGTTILLIEQNARKALSIAPMAMSFKKVRSWFKGVKGSFMRTIWHLILNLFYPTGSTVS